ncbi:outer membrane beta-barrel protein [Lacinutrix gracilariae]|uniref:Outer membrane beta-barrel protein n=1 Tax=Lacinutrix gracilariae TaxID=1747198 RepID=A0ABW5K3D9_9FLAO
MKFKQYILLVACSIGFVTINFAQHRRVPIKNGIGIQGGITQFDIITDNFNTKKGNGWIGGASATVELPHKWYNMSYSIQLSENNIGIAARPFALASEEYIDYKLFTAQISLQAHIKIVESFLTLDVGPMLQYNSEMELKDKDQENYIINNYSNLYAKDISDITKFNVDGAIGLSAGISHFRLKAQYIYGFTNMFNKLNKNNLDTSGSSESKFKGNQSMLAFTLMITL